MELSEIIRRRRMVHRFRPEPVDPVVLETVLESALHAPSGGFSQGFSMLTLTEGARRRRFWELTHPPEAVAHMDEAGPPVLVLCFVSKQRYLERYSRPDKSAAHLEAEAAWPVPYWYVDGGMAVMLLLLRAVDAGLDGWFFGITQGQAQLLSELGVPGDQELIGILGLGRRAADDRKQGSSVTVPRRRLEDVLHREVWR
jgi:nitroreductase